MAVRGSDQADLFVIGGYDILGTLTQLTDKIEAMTEEVTVLGSSWAEHGYTGLRHWTMSQNGFYNDAALSAHAALSTGPGAGPRVLVYGVEGNVSGEAFIGVQGAVQVNYETIITRGEFHKANAEYQANGVVEEGRIIRPLSGAVATGNTTNGAIDFTASSTGGGAAYFVITSLPAATATGLQLDLMHSPDNLTFTSYVGASPVTSSAPNSSWAQRVNSTAPVQRYVGARWTAGTGFPSTATFFVGFSTQR